MKKSYVIVNLPRNLFFYGFYSDKTWTAEVSDAKTFGSYDEAEEYLLNNSEFIGGYYEIIRIYWP